MRQYEIKYVGTWPSTNTFLGMNRFQSHKKKEEWIQTVRPAIEAAKFAPCETFSISIRYWSRLDPDNVVGVGIKRIVDELRYMGILTNDDKRFWKGLSVAPDPTLKHNTYIVTITAHS